MIKSKIIATGVTRTTDSNFATGSLSARDHVGRMIRYGRNPSAQPRQKRHMMRVLLCVLFLLSLSTLAVFADEIKPYSQPDFDRLAAEGKPVLLDFRADWCSICAAQAPVIGELMAQSRYRDLTTFTVDFDKAKELLKPYNVELQSTLIVLMGKQEEGRSVGDTSREGIERLLDKVTH
jgi:thiol-disulfide isomerase/thioredoxin